MTQERLQKIEQQYQEKLQRRFEQGDQWVERLPHGQYIEERPYNHTAIQRMKYGRTR